MILFICCCAATHLPITFMAPGNNGKSFLLHFSFFGVTTKALLSAAVLHHLLFVKHHILELICSFWLLVLSVFQEQWQPSCSGRFCPSCFHGTASTFTVFVTIQQILQPLLFIRHSSSTFYHSFRSFVVLMPPRFYFVQGWWLLFLRCDHNNLFSLYSTVSFLPTLFLVLKNSCKTKYLL